MDAATNRHVEEPVTYSATASAAAVVSTWIDAVVDGDREGWAALEHRPQRLTAEGERRSCPAVPARTATSGSGSVLGSRAELPLT